eukprot:snap_masked-scaffold_4-processed-gene-16.26-mRNA-1 protein AED:0.01 eAED:0.01 QI:0/-1/0/1/-1/1/1/0/216
MQTRRFLSIQRLNRLNKLINKRNFSNFPEHAILPMPALSPTMTEGNVGTWQVKEGDELNAGSVICEIETDKATVDYEAQDDVFLAKILVPEGAQGVAVGMPIGVTVEEADLVPEFANFTLDDIPTEHSPTEEVQATKLEEPKIEVPKFEKKEPEKVVENPPAMKAAPAPVAIPAVEKKVDISSPVIEQRVVPKNPLAKLMEEERLAYKEKYGTTFL